MDPPSDICGYTPDLPENWAGDSPVDGVQFTGEYSCTRPTYDGSDRCIWHARERGKYIEPDAVTVKSPASGYSPQAVLQDGHSMLTQHGEHVPERIDDAYLPYAVFRNIELNFYYFYNCQIVKSKLLDVTAEMAKFTDCVLDYTRFERCTIGATFDAGSLALSEFKETEFVGAKFTDTSLLGVRFYNSDFKTTTFESPEFSREVLFSGCSLDHGTDFVDLRVQKSGEYAHEARAKIYGQLADLCLSNREISKYVQYKKRERYAEGRKQLIEVLNSDTMRNGGLSSLVNYLAHEYSRLTMGYGYSIGRVLLSTIVFLVVGVVLYVGLTCSLPGHGLTPATSCATTEGVLHTFLDSTYFSIVTLATLGYGDIAPHGFSRIVASVQALGGLILGAQFVYVLATRTTL